MLIFKPYIVVLLRVKNVKLTEQQLMFYQYVAVRVTSVGETGSYARKKGWKAVLTL
jgi:hypothetical protein